VRRGMFPHLCRDLRIVGGDGSLSRGADLPVAYGLGTRRDEEDAKKHTADAEITYVRRATGNRPARLVSLSLSLTPWHTRARDEDKWWPEVRKQRKRKEGAGKKCNFE
jgi:hypothetical protein